MTALTEVQLSKNTKDYNTKVISNIVDYSLPKKSVVADILMDSGFSMRDALDFAVSFTRRDLYRITGLQNMIRLKKLGFILVDSQIVGGRVAFCYVYPEMDKQTCVNAIARVRKITGQ